MTEHQCPRERCHYCDHPLACEECWNHAECDSKPCALCDPHCWREAGRTRTCSHPKVDWRARALAAEERAEKADLAALNADWRASQIETAASPPEIVRLYEEHQIEGEFSPAETFRRLVRERDAVVVQRDAARRWAVRWKACAREFGRAMSEALDKLDEVREK